MSKLKIKNLDTNEFEELPLIQGEKGERGYSAYEIAVKNGYKGTEAEWTNAFLSPDGYYGKTEIDNKENNLKAENEYLNSVIEQAFTPVEKEGTSINYDNTINARFKDIKLCGDTTQNGTPTPENPVDINVVTGNQEVEVCGKNLFDYDNATKTNRDLGARPVANSTLKFYTYAKALQFFIPVSNFQGKELFYTNNSKYSYIRLHELDKDYKFIKELSSRSSFVLSSNAAYISVVLMTSSVSSEQKDISITATDVEAMLEQGSTATAYEPYQGSTYPLSLGSMELCKIGDYQDYIHKDNGKWYKHKVIEKVVLSGIEDIKNDNVYNNIYQFSFPVSNPLNNIYSITMSSNYFKSVEWDNSWAIDNSCVTLIGADKLLIMTSKYTNANDFKAFLKEKYNNNKPIICYYILATPTITEITDTTLLEQLEELAGATTYAGETNIVATSDGLTIIPKTTALTK